MPSFSIDIMKETQCEGCEYVADALERIVDKELWPFPTYSELIFEV